MTAAPIKAIFIDMDDTLIVNEVLYDTARAMLYGYLSGYGVMHNELEETIDRIDAELYKEHGYSRQRYPATYEAVLRHFIPDADAEMVTTVRGFAEKVFQTVAPAKPGVAEALEILQSRYPVYVVTAGDMEVQKFRLANLPFKDAIRQAFIVEMKSPDVFKQIARKLKIKPENIVMIGDSVKSDVQPAVAAGMRGVVIDAKTSGSYHPMHAGVDSSLPEGGYRFSSLLELARHIERTGDLSCPAVKPVAAPAPAEAPAPKRASAKFNRK